MNRSQSSSDGSKINLPISTQAQKIVLKENQKEEDNLPFMLETVSGNLIDFDNPTFDSIQFDDFAWAISRIPRFAGHTITVIPYNVAQHCVFVAELTKDIITNSSRYSDEEHFIIRGIQASIDICLGSIGQMSMYYSADRICNQIYLIALLHDSGEGYIGDIPSPLKNNSQIRNVIKNIEDKFLTLIFDKYGSLLDEKWSDMNEIFKTNVLQIVKYADKLAQRIEGYQFMVSRGTNWNLPKSNLIQLQNFSEPKSSLESYISFVNEYKKLVHESSK